MTSVSRTRVDALLRDALALDEHDRHAWIHAQCDGDAELREAVEELLRLAFTSAPGLEPGTAAHADLLGAALAEASLGDAGASPGQIIGSWRVVRELGRGGMAIVYLVERADGHFDQRAALKLVRAATGWGDVARRLQRERRILASLAHPDVAALLDGGQTDDGRPYFVMQLAEGSPLDRYCDDHRLTIDERLELFLRVCGAVEYAHRHLVVHRDLKPANIHVSDEGAVTLLDFGIAGLMTGADTRDDEAPTRPAVRALTPEYASPEQVRGEPVATASDVYQLGLVLYELLTGNRAQVVDARNTQDLARVVCETELTRPSPRVTSGAEPAAARRTTPTTLARRLRGDLDSIVARATRKAPDARYGSVADLAADVRRYRASLPVHARQGHWRYRAGKFVQRQRTAIAWSAAAIAAAAIVLPAWVDQRWRASREAERAEQVERLIEGLFALPNPRVQPEPLAAATYVDHAAALVRADLQGQPASEARLLTLLGRTYNALGHYQPSVTVLEQALAARRRLFGDGSLEVADTLEWLGQSQHYGGRYRDAETSVREALQIRARTLGAADPATVRVAIELGDLLHSRGRLVEAEEMLRGAVAALRGHVPTARPDDLGHDSLPRAIRDLANVLRDRGLLAEGAAHYGEAIDLFAALHGDASQQVAASKAYYGRLLVMQADYRGAEAVLGDATDVLRRIYDGQHSLVGVAVRNTASLRMAQGDLQEAERLLQESLDIHTAALGEGHPLTARVTAHQAELARKQGRAEEAVRLARQTLETFTRLDLADQPWALEARGTLGEALTAIGDRQAAAVELRSALEAAERQFVAGDARTARLRAALQTAERTDPAALLH